MSAKLLLHYWTEEKNADNGFRRRRMASEEEGWLLETLKVEKEAFKGKKETEIMLNIRIIYQFNMNNFRINIVKWKKKKKKKWKR